MKNDHNDIAKQKEFSITFTFEHQDNKLLINAQAEDILYCGFLEANPVISFDKVKKFLLNKNYELVAKNNQHMEISMGGGLIDLELKSKDQVDL